MHLHDKMVPTYKEVCSTMKECFPAIPSKDGDQLAKAQRRLLAEERMKNLCKDLRYAIPERLMTEQSTASDDMPQPTLRFKPVGPEGQMRIYLKARLHKETRAQIWTQAPLPSNRRKMKM